MENWKSQLKERVREGEIIIIQLKRVKEMCDLFPSNDVFTFCKLSTTNPCNGVVTLCRKTEYRTFKMSNV